jgi:hypothetical protein
MPAVTINGREVTVERFTLAKASRVITLLQLLQKQVPEIAKSWATFQKEYAQEYATEMDRMQAMVHFGPALEHLTDEDWERAWQKLRVPGSPSAPEVFFQLAPLIYERAEAVALRLLGIIAIDNATVQRYVESGDIWARVDEFVAEVIQPAPLDELVELVVVAAELIDSTILAKIRSLGDRVGKALRAFGVKTRWTPETSTTLSEQPEQPTTASATDSRTTDGLTPSESSPSPGISSTTSEPSTSSQTTAPVAA